MFKDILKTPDALRNAFLGQDDISAKGKQGLQAVRSGVDSLKTVLANHQQAKDALQQQQHQQASSASASGSSSSFRRSDSSVQAIALDGRPPSSSGIGRSTSMPTTTRTGSSSVFTRSLAGTVTESLKSISTGLGLTTSTSNNSNKGRADEWNVGHNSSSGLGGGWEAERSVPRDRDTRRSVDSSISGPLSLFHRIQHASSSSSLSSSSASALHHPSQYHRPSSSSNSMGSDTRLEGGAAAVMTTTLGSEYYDRPGIEWSSTQDTVAAAKATAQRLANVRAKDTTTFNIQRMPHVEQLAKKYHESWAEIHDHTAKNAASAEHAEALLEQVLAACERHVQASAQLWQEAKTLDKLDSTMNNIMTMTENIQKKLSGLEEAIEKLELDAEVVQFADWKKERVNELDRYMDAKRKEMWDKAELLAARSQEYQREESQRRLKMIEEQFASDMDEFRRRKMAEEAKLFGPIGEDDGYDNGSMGEYADHATFRDRRSSSSSSSIGMPGLMTPKELAATTKGFFERLSGTLSTTSLGHFPTSNSGSSRSSMADVLGTAPGGPMPSLPTIPSQVRRSTGASSASTAMRDSVLFIDNVPTEEADQEALNQFLGSEDSGSSDGEEQAGADQQRSKHLTVSLGKTVGDDDGENSSDGGVELVPEEDIEGVDETSEDEEDEEEDDDEEEDEEEESEESDSEDDGMDPITRARLAKLGMGHGHKSGSTIAVFALANASKTQLPS